jgi:hypothetical protein
MDKEEIATSEKISLATFVEQNHKLLTIIGVFTAISIFATNINLLFVATFLSFLFLLLTILLWFELISKFPKNGSTNLGWFEAILGICVLGLIFYWIVEYQNVWEYILPFVIQLIFLAIFSYTVKKTNFFNRVFNAEPGQKKTWRYLIYFITIFATLALGLYLGNLLSPTIVNYLGMLKQGIK